MADIEGDPSKRPPECRTAAPSLLLVLESIHALCRARDHAEKFTAEDAWNVISAVQNSAEAAIAKATMTPRPVDIADVGFDDDLMKGTKGGF